MLKWSILSFSPRSEPWILQKAPWVLVDPSTVPECLHCLHRSQQAECNPPPKPLPIVPTLVDTPMEACTLLGICKHVSSASASKAHVGKSNTCRGEADMEDQKTYVQFRSVQLLSRVWIFAIPWIAAARPPCPSLTPRVYPTHVLLESSSSSQGFNLKRWTVSANETASQFFFWTGSLFQAYDSLLYFYKSIRSEVWYFQFPLTQIYYLYKSLLLFKQSSCFSDSLGISIIIYYLPPLMCPIVTCDYIVTHATFLSLLLLLLLLLSRFNHVRLCATP